MNDIKKLPRWAQDHIALLEMRLREKTSEADVWKNNPPSRVYIPNYDHDLGNRRFLDDRTIVRFVVGEGHQHYIEASLQSEPSLDGEVEFLQIVGGDTIAVIPRASNMVRVIAAR